LLRRVSVSRVFEISRSVVVSLLLAESGDEFEADDNVADSRDKRANNRKQIDDDARNSPSGFAGRRMLPAPPKTGVDYNTRIKVTDIVAKNAQRRQDVGVKLATDCGSATGEENKDNGAFAMTYDAPLSRRDLHPRGSDGSEINGTTTTSWAATMLSLAESKLQIRQRPSDSHEEESAVSLNVSAPPRTTNRTKTSAVADMTPNGAKMTQNVIVSSGRQLPTTTEHFVPISNGVAPKLIANKSSRPTSDLGRSKTKASGGPNAGGSRSARTTPQQVSSPTKEIQQTRIRSRSNARDDYTKKTTTTTTTTTTTGARTARTGVSDISRRNVVNGDTSRRYRTRDEVATDSTTTTARQPGSRNTATRQNVHPPAPTSTSTRLRSISQKRPGEVGGIGRQQPARTTADTVTVRSQYARSPDRGRTSTRQSDFVSRMTDAQTLMPGSRSMYRSSSASVLPTPRRTASRSPQRPYVPASSTEQQQKLEAFKKRMSYDPSKSAAMGRAAGRRSIDGSFGSTERLSPTSSGSRRSSHGSVSGLSDDDAFGRSAAAVAQLSSSVAGNISALSRRVGSGHTLSTVDDDDDEVSTNTVRCSPIVIVSSFSSNRQHLSYNRCLWYEGRLCYKGT